ncbi:MAG: GGDEF domain-containing protein [Nitrospirota bacterium]|nr:GGDEF domain-containing protein [Nitrospirota bacterium]
MNPELEKKLQACPNLPSPPTVAIQIIQLANQPDTDFQRIIELLNCDPALASKILRIANSPIYPYVKKVENLHQALMVLGLNATISLALSFSLVQSLQSTKGKGLDYTLYWKRALIAGTACQVLGSFCEVEEIAELYLAGLLQDLGMLALDQVFPELYLTYEGQQCHHASLISHEEQALGLSHGAVGSWLLTQWNFTDRLRLAVAGSDDPSRIPGQDERARFAYCVSLSGMMAEIFLRETDDDYLQKVTRQASTLLQLNPETFLETLEVIKERLPEIAGLFDTTLPTWDDPQVILENARESLLLRNLQAFKQVEELRINTVNMEAQFHNLEETHRHDSLTGTFTRAYLNQALETSFQQAVAKGECLTLIFADLDKFKSVNDTYGHHAGDVVLQSAARLLLSKLRTTDMVGRFGGEEFVLILPKATTSGAEFVCERILTAFRETAHEISENPNLIVTISLGIATHTPEKPYTQVTDLLQNADASMYHSKIHGGNQATFYHSIMNKQPVSR